MFTRELLLDLLRHMEWADARVWAAVPEQDPPDPKVQGWLVHMHTVQRAFLATWTGVDPMTVVRQPADFASVAETRVWARSYYPDAYAFLEGVDAARLNAVARLPWSDHVAKMLGGPVGPTTLGETCLQVTSHTTHHRGQVNVRLREIGAEPPLVDYIAWLWFGRPAPEWKA